MLTECVSTHAYDRTLFGLPEIRWPWPARGTMHVTDAKRMADTLGEHVALAYLYVACVADTELQADRPGSKLHVAAEDFLLALRQRSDASTDA
jgi:hypothetical protein